MDSYKNIRNWRYAINYEYGCDPYCHDYDYVDWQESIEDFYWDDYLNDTNRIRQEKIDNLLGLNKPTFGDVLPENLKLN